MATQGHSRSFILQSVTGQQKGSISPYNIAGLISEVSEEVATQIAKNCRRQPPHSHLTPPPTGTPAHIRMYLIFPETRVIGLHFCRCMYGSIFIQICAGLQKVHLFCNRLRFGLSRSFRVIQGRWFWYQSKVRIRLPISQSLWLRSYIAPFSRYGDLLAKNCLFLLHFWQRVRIACYAERCLSYDRFCLTVRPSDRLSDRPSHSGIMPKRLHLGSCGLHWRIAPWF